MCLVCLPDEIALQVVNVSLGVHQILLVFPVNHDSSQASRCQLLWVVNVYNVILFIVHRGELLPLRVIVRTFAVLQKSIDLFES